ncbi:hypothetical protein ACFQ61_27490 [Streptomyces sp. NPDC056500]|uniref:hypothetical protein n=1 Tax=Streptomyces sp. NPDC056500 TaxID=3345840 RepID=UPI00368703DD
MTHSKGRNLDATLEALASALGSADADSADYFFELLAIRLGDTRPGKSGGI